MASSSDVERISELLLRIENRIGDPLSPQWASHTCAWALGHFHRRFTAVVGESFTAYVRGRKLHRAAGDLLGTQISVSRIAHAADFSHVPAFYKSFSRRYGIPPLEYRSRGIDLWHLSRDPLQPAFLEHLQNDRVDGEPSYSRLPARKCIGKIASGTWSDFGRLFHGFRADVADAGLRPGRIHLFLCASREDVVARSLTVRIGVENGRMERTPPDWVTFMLPGGPCAEFRHHGGSHAFTCFHIWRHWNGRHRYAPWSGYSMELDWTGENPFLGRLPMVFRIPVQSASV